MGKRRGCGWFDGAAGGAYYVRVKQILSAGLVLGGVLAAFAQTNPPATAKSEPPISYTGRVQMHNVPLAFKTPDQLRQEEERGAKSAARSLPEAGPALDEAPITPVIPPTPPRMPLKRKEKESNWLDRPAPSDKQDTKNEPSGWGWLADEVRLADQRRTRGEDKEAQRLEEENVQEGWTNRDFSAGNSWSGSGRAERREPDSRNFEQHARSDPALVRRDLDPVIRPSADDSQMYQANPAQDSGRPPLSPEGADRYVHSPLEQPGRDHSNPLNPEALGSPSLGWAIPGRTEDRGATLFDLPGSGHLFEPVLSSPTPLGFSMSEPSMPLQLEDGGLAPPSLAQPALFDSVPAIRANLGQGPASPGIQTKTLPW